MQQRGLDGGDPYAGIPKPPVKRMSNTGNMFLNQAGSSKGIGFNPNKTSQASSRRVIYR